MKNSNMLVSALLLLTIHGCSSIQEATNPTPEGLRPKTAGALGILPDEVTISSIQSDGSNTYYLAQTPRGTYACKVLSGKLFAISTAGYSISPECTIK